MHVFSSINLPKHQYDCGKRYWDILRALRREYARKTFSFNFSFHEFGAASEEKKGVEKKYT